MALLRGSRSEGVVLNRTHFAFAFLFALSACDQAPDDDNSRTSSLPKSEMSQSRESPRGKISRPTRGTVDVYELRGLPGMPLPFSTKDKCDAARKVVIETQAKEDKKLGDQGILFPNRPALVCFPV